MDSPTDRLEEAEAASLATPGPIRSAIPLPVAAHGSASEPMPPISVTHRSRRWRVRFARRERLGRGSNAERSKTTVAQMSRRGLKGDGEEPSAIHRDPYVSCGIKSGSAASVAARTISGVATSALFT